MALVSGLEHLSRESPDSLLGCRADYEAVCVARLMGAMAWWAGLRFDDLASRPTPDVARLNGRVVESSVNLDASGKF